MFAGADLRGAGSTGGKNGRDGGGSIPGCAIDGLGEDAFDIGESGKPCAPAAQPTTLNRMVKTNLIIAFIQSTLEIRMLSMNRGDWSASFGTWRRTASEIDSPVSELRNEGRLACPPVRRTNCDPKHDSSSLVKFANSRLAVDSLSGSLNQQRYSDESSSACVKHSVKGGGITLPMCSLKKKSKPPRSDRYLSLVAARMLFKLGQV
jgi:hypothetical protein